jgi:hypothetical protein
MPWPLLKLAQTFKLGQVQLEGPSGLHHLGNTHHRMLEILASWADHRDGWCRHHDCSRKGLALMLNVTERHVARVRRDLEKVGLLETRLGGGRLPGGKGRANDYQVSQLLLERGAAAAIFWAENGDIGGHRGHPSGGKYGDTGVTVRDQNTVTPGSPPVGRSPDVRRARARARDGMRFASPAGSARADFLSSRASLGPRKGESADGERDQGPDPRLAGAVPRCPRCRDVLSAPYEHDCAAVYEAPPRESEQVAPPPVLPDHEQLLHEHEQRLARERANHHLEVSR